MSNKFPCSSCKKECISELIGTYMLVLVGPSSIIVSSMIPGIGAIESLVFIAFSFGATVGLVILLLGKYSDVIINPAITFGATLGRTLHSKYFIPYLFFQITGGLLAGFTLRVVFASVGSVTELGSTRLAIGVNPIFGIAIEAIGTFILTISALFASTRVRGVAWQALLVGFTLFVLILFIGPFTGAGFNPARSLGPSLASGYVGNLYVYFVGPISGAIAAGILFRRVRNGRKGKLNTLCLC